MYHRLGIINRMFVLGLLVLISLQATTAMANCAVGTIGLVFNKEVKLGSIVAPDADAGGAIVGVDASGGLTIPGNLSFGDNNNLTINNVAEIQAAELKITTNTSGCGFRITIGVLPEAVSNVTLLGDAQTGTTIDSFVSGAKGLFPSNGEAIVKLGASVEVFSDTTDISENFDITVALIDSAVVTD